MKSKNKPPYCKMSVDATVRWLKKQGFLKGGKVTAKGGCSECSRLGHTCTKCGGRRHRRR